ncbi:MAG: hypothetical protein IRZ16_24135, partial [Myxococcaceae bacterium]|nr:hypothetical protein [Myxococcaceae bacterium]
SVFIPTPGEILEQNVPLVADPQTGKGVSCPTFPDSSPDCTPNPVYPGNLDDYYSMLAHGHIVAATGNSDSHSDEAEAGLPRTYLRVGESANRGTMRNFDELDGVEALKHQRAIVTNGPFVELWVDDHPIGDHVVAPDGKVKVRVRVQAAPWVDVTRVSIMHGGRGIKVAEPVKVFTLCEAPEATGCVKKTDAVLRLDETFEVSGLDDGAFLTAEVNGERSMWPVYTPNEIPAIAIGEAVGAIGSAFGFSDKWGRYKPQETQAVVPFAVTNPVFVDRTLKQALTLTRTAVPLGPAKEGFQPRRITDLRRFLATFHGE